MTNKEFQRLSRAQLIEIIYQLQLKQDDLTEENQRLSDALEEKRIRINKAGSIANAALELNEFFSSAQKAADQYLEEIRALREEAEAEKEKILKEAREEAAAIISHAKAVNSNYDEELMKLENKNNDSENG